MIDRPLWTQKIRENWNKAPIVWLSGVRRVGKTTLAQSLGPVKFLNCDLPSAVSTLEDPEAFFSTLKESHLVLDEVHQLPDPSRVLKIAADAFPRLRILATGSSTLAATQKFRDSLAGRKRTVELLPVLITELEKFGNQTIQDRLFRGGLPPALLAENHDPSFYSEWLDSYYARDVQELFKVEKRTGFLKLLEIILQQSGGIFDAVTLAKSSGLSRPTVLTYLEVFQLTHVAHILRPYHGGGQQEIVKQPKVYGFDTGFVAHVKGWNDLRNEDCGYLWEHLVLDLLLSLNLKSIHYWRTKQQHEIDFVIPQGRDVVDAIECKWKSTSLNLKNFKAFRELHPKGRNLIVTHGQRDVVMKKVDGMEIVTVNAEGLVGVLG